MTDTSVSPRCSAGVGEQYTSSDRRGMTNTQRTRAMLIAVSLLHYAQINRSGATRTGVDFAVVQEHPQLQNEVDNARVHNPVRRPISTMMLMKRCHLI